MAMTRTSPLAGSPSPAAGFTLVELLVVLSIIGLMIAIAMPTLSRLTPGLRLNAAAQDVASRVKAARREAMQQNRAMAVTIDLDARQVRVGSARPIQLDPRLGISLLTAVSELQGAGVGSIRFFPDGTSTGGRVSLRDADRRYDVVVAWLTGRVSVED